LDIKKKIGESPNSTGVYVLKDAKGKVIYIGKAVSIRKRLKSHFLKTVFGKQKALIDNVSDLEYILTPDEPAALLLEAALISRYGPKYNISLRDDKSYPRLKLTVNEQYPRLFITRKHKDDGALYFGPYTNAVLLRKALAFMRRLFPLRTCQRLPKKECLNYHIGQCLAPCVNEDNKSQYVKVVEEARLFLGGRTDELIRSLSQDMQEASCLKDYEKAAKIRDRIKALAQVTGKGMRFSQAVENIKLKANIDYEGELEQLRSVIGLRKPPETIEAFDISNIMGKKAVGSMVSFKNAKPNPVGYRRFKIKTVKAIDDYSMMREVISRRYTGLIKQRARLPELIVVDGGKGHLAAAKRQLHALGILDVPVVSIAKNPDRIYISEKKEHIILGRFAGALMLMQRIRDEAHRFAIDYHRILRRHEIESSELDNIKGIGPKRKQKLIRYFGSLERIKKAEVEELKRIEFINEKEAKAIYDYFRV
jgi:excinuclease ABC subunit C